jgi:hypothetical protein
MMKKEHGEEKEEIQKPKIVEYLSPEDPNDLFKVSKTILNFQDEKNSRKLLDCNKQNQRKRNLFGGSN